MGDLNCNIRLPKFKHLKPRSDKHVGPKTSRFTQYTKKNNTLPRVLFSSKIKKSGCFFENWWVLQFMTKIRGMATVVIPVGAIQLSANTSPQRHVYYIVTI